MTDKPLPSCPEIERMMLGAILVNSPGATAALDALHSEDFSTETHRRIFSAMRLVNATGMGVDRMTVIENLHAAGQLDSIGGMTYLAELDTAMPAVPNLESWTRLLHEKAALRRTAHTCQYAVNRVLAGNGNAAEILADLGERLGGISKNGAGGLRVDGLEDIYKVDFSGTKYLEEPAMPEGALVAITGDAESGKSSLCTSWLRNIAAAGRPCLVLDRDNPYQVVRDRFDRLEVPEAAIKVWGQWSREYPPQPDSPRIVEWIAGCELKPAIMVDGLSGFIEGDENDSVAMLEFMLRLRRITGLGATVAIIHNCGKGDTTKDFRGHSSFKDKVDQAFVVTNMGSNRLLDKVYLRCFKSRFGFTGSLLYRYDDGKFSRDCERLAAPKAEHEQLWKVLHANPGANVRQFETLAMSAGIGRDKARDFLHIGVEFKEIRTEPGPRKTQRHFPAENSKHAD